MRPRRTRALLTRTHRRHDERGMALSSPIALVSAAVVVVAGVAFVTTGSPQQPADVAAPVTASAEPSVSPSSDASEAAASSVAPQPVIEKKKKPKKPVVRRGETYVEVYNNSGISGLAGSTASRAQGAGWQVVGSDNWYGTIPASTVYYPERLAAHAKVLGRDLGISRVAPAIAPMRFDRLTVILTTDYSG
jgi:hypothetical protein